MNERRERFTASAATISPCVCERSETRTGECRPSSWDDIGPGTPRLYVRATIDQRRYHRFTSVQTCGVERTARSATPRIYICTEMDKILYNVRASLGARDVERRSTVQFFRFVWVRPAIEQCNDRIHHFLGAGAVLSCIDLANGYSPALDQHVHRLCASHATREMQLSIALHILHVDAFSVSPRKHAARQKHL